MDALWALLKRQYDRVSLMRPTSADKVSQPGNPQISLHLSLSKPSFEWIENGTCNGAQHNTASRVCITLYILSCRLMLCQTSDQLLKPAVPYRSLLQPTHKPTIKPKFLHEHILVGQLDTANNQEATSELTQ